MPRNNYLQKTAFLLLYIDKIIKNRGQRPAKEKKGKICFHEKKIFNDYYIDCFNIFIVYQQLR